MDEMPAEMLAALRGLVAAQAPMLIAIRPWDAWVSVGVIQFASRNPHLSETQRAQIVGVGRAIQEALIATAPQAAAYLEDGWNPALDVPIEGEAGGQ